jgi:hypothetical protein
VDKESNMKKKSSMLLCIAAVAIATFVGKKVFVPNASWSNLLLSNVEGLSQGEQQGKYLVLHYPCYDWVYYNGQMNPIENGKYSATSSLCNECGQNYHVHNCSTCKSVNGL